MIVDMLRDMKNRNQTFDDIRLTANYLVVLIHSFAAFQYCDRTLFEFKFWQFVSHSVGSVAMPALFFLSGYLMFQGLPEASWRNKLVRRVKRLVIPYLTWNVFFVVFYLSLAMAVPRLAARVDQFGLRTFAGAVSKVVSFMVPPIDTPLWYMRTIFVYALLSPLLLILLKTLKGIGAYALVVVCLVVSNFYSLQFAYPAYSLFAFVVGAHFAVLAKDPLAVWSKYRVVFLLVSVAGMMGLGWLFVDRWWAYSVWRDIAHVAALPSLLLLVPALKSVFRMIPKPVYDFLQRSSFFLYCSHFLFCSMLLHLVAPFLSGIGGGKFTLLVAIFIGGGIPICLVAYWLGKRLFGRWFGVFDGTL